jgi:hypothetical protein
MSLTPLLAFLCALIIPALIPPSGKTMRMTIKQSIVDLVIQRAGGYCEKCGRPASESMALHHRKLKVQGRQRLGQQPDVGSPRMPQPWNRLDPLRPAFAADKGWMVASWDDPENTPMHLPDGRIVLLQNDGKITSLKEGKL